jgi:class 3 adenylate cyclase/tetratricopeptide (TPR) repeat protein
MKCPKCQFENPKGAKFCVECGSKFEVPCPVCGFSNQPGFKFCAGCGQKMAPVSALTPSKLSFDEKLRKIQKYLPKGLPEKILAQTDRIEGERKQVTVMFCDMEGFTPLTERLGPEEAYGIMDQVYEILIHKVYDYEGNVNEMTGDGIMALFGAPLALEDAPQRAIRSSLAIHRDMARFSDKLKQETPATPPIRMRIGIHTGPVVVGSLGNELRVEFKAVGDTVNIAARLEQLSEPGTTCVSEDTLKATEGLFSFEPVGERTLKGKNKPIRVYRVISTTSRRTRFEVSADRGLAPFVGRTRELDLLLHAFKIAKEGRGQAVSIVSEAGMGKSRLLYEFRNAIINEEATFLVAKCLSYCRSVPYHPVADALRASFDIRDDEGDKEIREKVRRALKILKADDLVTFPYLLELLSVKESTINESSMSPEAKKDRTLEALKTIIVQSSTLRPIILAVEDLHWIDRDSQDVMRELLESIAGWRVLLIYTFRPEFVHTWGSRSYHGQITLNRLSSAESSVIITHLLNTNNIEEELQNLILEKSEGNPFFIEEFVKSLEDLKIIEKTKDYCRLTRDGRSIVVPSTIEDMIMTRVDHLPDDTRGLLQIGSAIEREFDNTLVGRVTALPERELLSQLSILKDAELLFERGLYPKSVYIFKHALTRDVVYNSILLKGKKRIHERIGKVIEELYAHSIEDYYASLVHHFTVSENHRKVADYSRLACKKAENSMSLYDAAEYAAKLIAALEKLPMTAELQVEIIDARTTLGFYLFRMSNMAEAKASIDPVLELVVERGINGTLGKIDIIMGSHKYMVEEDFQPSVEYLERAIKISDQTHDFSTGAYARFMLGLVFAFNCDFEKAIPYFELLLNLSIAAERKWVVSVMKSNLSIYVYNYSGMVAQGYKTSEEAVRLAEESGDIYSKAMSYASHGTSCYYMGLLENAKQYLNMGISLTGKINFVALNAVAQQWLGHVYFDLGEYQKAQDCFSKAIHVRKLSRLAPSSVNLNKIALMRAKLLNGEKDVDHSLMYSYAIANRVKIYQGCMARYIADILIHLDEGCLQAAEDWVGKAIEADRRNGMKCDLGRDYALCAEVFRKKGQRSQAKGFLSRAIGVFKECGADAWMERTALHPLLQEPD